MVTIKSYGEGTCIWCAKQREGVDLVSDDRSFTGFLCFADLKRLLRLKTAASNGQGREGAIPSTTG
jgi:hypothetical protein